jgi:hypothetical protein
MTSKERQLTFEERLQLREPCRQALAPEIVAELKRGDGPIAAAINEHLGHVQRAAWRCGLSRAQHVIRYAGLPDSQTKALIDEIESYTDKEME